MNKPDGPMNKATWRSSPSWTDVKAKLAAFDRAGLLGLVQDLYAASRTIRPSARAPAPGRRCEPYKANIDRWLWPDVFKDQSTSVSKAKKVVGDHKKASGTVEGLVEPRVFYCEWTSGFNCDIGMDEEACLSVLVRMLEQALKAPHYSRRFAHGIEKHRQVQILFRSTLERSTAFGIW